MKILYVITRAECGGGQVHVLCLLKAFCGAMDLHLATGESGYLCDEARKLAIPVYRIPNLTQPIHPLKDAMALVETCRLISALNPDLIHAHTSKAGLIARLAARMQGVPCLFTAHTWSFADGMGRAQQWISKPLEKLAAKPGWPIIAVSEANRQAAIEANITGAERLVTIRNGISDTPARARPELAGPPTIVMVARFVPQKNQLLLLRALSKINERYRLVFVGDGPSRPVVEEAASRLQISDHVEFAGELKDVDAVLCRSQIFVLSTNWEGLPICILEAMRSGLPVIASDVGGVAEAVHHEKTGYLVAKGDETELTHRLRELILSPALRARMGRAGRDLYECSFMLDRMVSTTAAVYRATLQTAGGLP